MKVGMPCLSRFGGWGARVLFWGWVGLWIGSSWVVGVVGEGAALRVLFTARVLPELNRTEARASIRAWSKSVAKELGIPVNPEPLVMDGGHELEEMVVGGKADAVAMTSQEYAELGGGKLFGRLLLGVSSGAVFDRFVLGVRKGSGLRSAGDLAGKKLILVSVPRTWVGEVWLEAELAGLGLKGLDEHFGGVMRVGKPSLAVLPVFFGNADSFFSSKESFQTMCELNPQLALRLEVVAESPPLVSTVLAFRAGYEGEEAGRVIEAMKRLHSTPAGRQLLTVFQLERLVEGSAKDLETVIELEAGRRQRQEERREVGR